MAPHSLAPLHPFRRKAHLNRSALDPSGEHIFHSMPLQNTHGDSMHSGTCHPLSPRSKVARRQYSVRTPMMHASVAHTHVHSLLLQGRHTHTPHTMTQATLVFLSPSQTQTHITTDGDSQHTHTQVRTESQPLSAQSEADPTSGKWTVGEWAYHAPVQPSPTTTEGVSTFNFTIFSLPDVFRRHQ